MDSGSYLVSLASWYEFFVVQSGIALFSNAFSYFLSKWMAYLFGTCGIQFLCAMFFTFRAHHSPCKAFAQPAFPRFTFSYGSGNARRSQPTSWTTQRFYNSHCYMITVWGHSVSYWVGVCRWHCETLTLFKRVIRKIRYPVQDYLFWFGTLFKTGPQISVECFEHYAMLRHVFNFGAHGLRLGLRHRLSWKSRE